jgi:hypothetical protein
MGNVRELEGDSKGRLVSNGHRVSAWGDDKNSGDDGSDGCLITQMFLMLLSSTLKNGEGDTSFVVYFPTILKVI